MSDTPIFDELVIERGYPLRRYPNPKWDGAWMQARDRLRKADSTDALFMAYYSLAPRDSPSLKELGRRWMYSSHYPRWKRGRDDE